MSEQIRNEDPVFTALNLERDISKKLEEAGDRARADVRNDMEKWLELMDKPKVRKQYEEELGELDAEIVRNELLNAIRGTYPQVAKQLGWEQSMERAQEQQYGQAA